MARRSKETAKQPKQKRQIAKLLVPIAIIVLAGWVFANRGMLNDQLVLANYEPSSEIAALAERADLSEEGTQRFYVNKPELRGKSNFNQACGSLETEKANVLGCFTGNKIYIYDVPEGELDGVEEVTAAHEMLHAAYVRLSEDEKQRVIELIERQKQEYIAPHVREIMKSYDDLNEAGKLNELHSILATEQARLIPELQEYYSQYFNDRSTVVALAADYRGVFESLQREQKQLTNQLNGLAKLIEQSTAQLQQRITAYNQAVETFNSEARSGEMSLEEFERRKAELETERLIIEDALATDDALRNRYNKLIAQYEDLTVQMTELENTVDSSAPQLDSQ